MPPCFVCRRNYMKRIVRTLLAFIIAITATTSSAQENISALLPMPQKIEQRTSKECFDLNRATITRNDCSNSAYILEELTSIIEERTGIKPGEKKSRNSIEIIISRSKGKEEYSIDMELALKDANALCQAWIDAGVAE